MCSIFFFKSLRSFISEITAQVTLSCDHVGFVCIQKQKADGEKTYSCVDHTYSHIYETEHVTCLPPKNDFYKQNTDI